MGAVRAVVEIAGADLMGAHLDLDDVAANHPLAMAELDALRELADSEGTRAVEYMRRARKAEAELAALRKHAERGRWLVGWLTGNGLLHALRCRPAADASTGDYWVLQMPAILAGDSCEGYGKTEEEAIDAAMESKP